jgi:hypothetical protein
MLLKISLALMIYQILSRNFMAKYTNMVKIRLYFFIAVQEWIELGLFQVLTR